jgi:dolichol-phosphate mannosyltransferase
MTQTAEGLIQKIVYPGDSSPNEWIDVAVVVPTYNERGNVPELIARLKRALRDFEWELIFVDDNSPDGTAELIREYAAKDRHIRLLHRIGRRGLSSACIEGMLATPAEYIAVMDADLQHDESILPEMVDRLRSKKLDVVVATRNGEGGCMGDFARARVRLSSLGKQLSGVVCRCRVSDPMSGFFVVSRTYFHRVVPRLQEGGFKILLDMLASSERPVRLGEVGYHFNNRTWGQSKLDANAAAECLFLIVNKFVNKFLGGFVSPGFTAFALVGVVAVTAYFSCMMWLFQARHFSFTRAQILATFAGATVSFLLHNLIHHRDRRLRGFSLWEGLAAFWLACSFGVLANVGFGAWLLRMYLPWYVAGLAGVAVSSAWNYALSEILSWQCRLPYKRTSSVRDNLQQLELPQKKLPEPMEALSAGSKEKIVA